MSKKKVIDVGEAPAMSLARREAPVPMALKEYNSEQLGMIRNTIARGCNDTELVFFLTFCRNAGLDPFTKEIYAIPRGQGERRQLTLQMSIDGLRRRAHETGAYAGMDRPVFGPEKSLRAGQANVTVPEWCEIVVYKLVGGQRVPYPARCRFAEYAPPLADRKAHMWRQMPFNQLEKCTEAKALRRAFPEQVRGLYAPEEMDSADPPIEVELPEEQAADPEPRAVEYREKPEPAAPPSGEDLSIGQEAAEDEWMSALRDCEDHDAMRELAGGMKADDRLTARQVERLSAYGKKRWHELQAAQ